MDALLAKLTNLGYEFFGVLLPGCAAILGLTLLWIAAGNMMPVVSVGILPQISFESALSWVETLLARSILITLMISIPAAYFLGHLLTWIARGGRKYDKVGFRQHICGALSFGPPKLNASYDSNLEQLFREAAGKLLPAGKAPEWGSFYPVAKMYLMQNASQSLVPTYQNKYTLHRAFAVVSALIVWGSLAIIICGVIMDYLGCPAKPDWPGVIGLCAASLVFSWGFSSSYLYFWKLWGNYIITETYTLLR